MPATTGVKGAFIPITPLRVLDTRNGTGAPVAPLAANQSIKVQVTGVGGAIPSSGVLAVALVLTAVNPSTGSYLVVWQAGKTMPVVSLLTTTAGTLATNLVVSQVNAAGKVAIYNSAGTTDVVADVVGWFSDGTVAGGYSFVPIQPARIFDSRATHNTLGPRSQDAVPVAGVGGIPSSGATGLLFTVTAVGPTAGTSFVVWPGGSPIPIGPSAFVPSTVNTSLLAVTGLSSSGAMTIHNAAGTTDVLADAAGYFTSGSGTVFHAITPIRMMDSRNGTGVPQAPLGPGGVDTLQVTSSTSPVPLGATAVVINIGVAEATAGSYVTLWPTGQPQPAISNLSFGPATFLDDLAVVKLSSAGAMNIFNNAGSTDVIGDVVGYFK